jgi:hypothetical protein
MPLTDIQIRTAKPGSKPYKLADGGWLFLLVNPSGSKLWRMAYRYDGREKTLSLGAYPEMSLKDARAKRDEAKALLAAGTDPGQQKKLDRLAKTLSNATTFKGVADEYLEKLKREGRAPATLNKVEWLLALAAPQIGDRPIAEISAPEILAVLRKIETRGNHETARRLGAISGSSSSRSGNSANTRSGSMGAKEDHLPHFLLA